MYIYYIALLVFVLMAFDPYIIPSALLIHSIIVFGSHSGGEPVTHRVLFVMNHVVFCWA